MLAVTAVASSLANIKTRYVKYLEAFCAANGIDVANIKRDAPQLETAEIYFGGLPILVGLKYFTSLRTLRIIAQDVTSLRPLVEVAGTLEELWVCEGSLKDLAGLEGCLRLKRLFLYDNQIENAAPISALTALYTVILQGNRIGDLNFISSLPYLTSLNVSRNSLTDSAFIDGIVWPQKLKHVDVSENKIVSFNSLFPLSACSLLRSSSLLPSSTLCLSATDTEELLAWHAHHFHFLESVDGDSIGDSFMARFAALAEERSIEACNDCSLEEERLMKILETVEKHSKQIIHKLATFSAALERLKEGMPAKDNKREIVKHIAEYAAHNQKNATVQKKNWKTLSRLLLTMKRASISIQLEGTSNEAFKPGDETTMKLLEHFANFNSSGKHLYELKLRWCIQRRVLAKEDIDRLHFIDCDPQRRAFDERSFVRMLDRHFSTSFRQPPIRLWKDFEIMKKELDDNKRLVNVAIVVTRGNKLTARTEVPTEKAITVSVAESSDNSDKSIPSIVADPETMWTDIQLVAMCSFEICLNNELRMDDLLSLDVFEDRMNDQLRRLREMNINLEQHKKGKLSPSPLPMDTHFEMGDSPIDMTMSREPTLLEASTKSSYSVKELLNPDGIETRWLSANFELPANVLTIRSPLELAFAFSRTAVLRDMISFKNSVTFLDLSSRKLKKLAGIEDLVHLQGMTLRGNRLTSIKKLSALKNLRSLDISENRIAKIDELPELLTHLSLHDNHVSCLGFCHNLQLLTNLDIRRNRIKSLKGLEKCKSLTAFRAGANLISSQDDIAPLTGLASLSYLDLRGCPAAALDTYRAHVIALLPSLKCLDLVRVPLDERLSPGRPMGRALTMEWITKRYPLLISYSSLDCSSSQFEVISLEQGDLARLSHIQSLDVSGNGIAQLQELSELTGLRSFDASSNRLVSLYSEAVQAGERPALPSLSSLRLCSNDLTNSLLAGLNLPRISTLVEIDLSKNQISKFDCSLFASFPVLEKLDVSQNEIKSIHQAPMPRVAELYLQGNRLKDLNGLVGATGLLHLDVSSNRISSLASLKSLAAMGHLKDLDCTGNSVCDRRVYTSFIRNQVHSLEVLDGSPLSPLLDVPNPSRRRSSAAAMATAVIHEGGDATNLDMTTFRWAHSSPLPAGLSRRELDESIWGSHGTRERTRSRPRAARQGGRGSAEKTFTLPYVDIPSLTVTSTTGERRPSRIL